MLVIDAGSGHDFVLEELVRSSEDLKNEVLLKKAADELVLNQRIVLILVFISNEAQRLKL